MMHQPTRAALPRGRRRLLAALSMLLATLLAWRLTVTPPEHALAEMEHAFRALRQAEAAHYAPHLFQQAADRRQDALQNNRLENSRRLFFLRDYDAVAAEARAATALAEDGRQHARHVQDSLRWHTGLGIALLQGRLDEIRAQLDRLPHRPTLHQHVTDAALLLDKSARQLDDGHLLQSTADLRAAAALLDLTHNGLYQLLDAYFAALPQWRQWADETQAWSRQHHAPALVVDKMAHRCYLYVNGVLKASFVVELGPQWIGPKRSAGDLSTPEGRYHITRKRGPGETIYYLALDINYPNAEDQRRFDTARRDGTLPADARIGGNIEIHGDGGRSFNWTQGCVALNNEDMKALFDQVHVGTPVTIVGALSNPFQPPPAHPASR